MNLLTFGHITTSLFVLAILDVNAKSILINNSTVKIIISEHNSSNGIQTSVLMDRLYKDMKIPFQIEKKIQAITDKVSKLENKVESKSSFSTKTKSKGEGFYAYVSNNLANPGSGHTIVYDVVMTNFKNGFNKHTGIFTVPVEGLYSLTWVTRVYCSKSYTTELHVNKSIAGSTFAYCGADTVTGNAVVQLHIGDVVFVRTLAGSGEIRSNKDGRTSFSGFLVN